MTAGGKRLLAFGIGAAALALLLATPGMAEEGAWAERVQVLLKTPRPGAAPEIERRKVRVWDFQPGLGLDFTWEPAAGAGLAADGTVDGEGRLVWRVPGSASYDKRAVFSTYSGRLANGRPDGEGRLALRSGESFAGTWRAGLLEGRGVHVDEAGNRYEGEFRAGRPEGRGRLMLVSGEVFEGEFRDGLRDGEGVTVLPGGTRYASRWARGAELGAPRPERLADARIGGVFPTDSTGGAAGRVEIGVAVDGRMNAQSDMQYQQVVRDADIAIFPQDPEINAVWNGTGEVTSFQRFAYVDWENSPAFLAVDLRAADGDKVRLSDLQLKVERSETYRKPMLSVREHRGCVGYRPDFSLVNLGWGRAENMVLTVRFSGYSYDQEGNFRTDVPTSRAFSVPIPSFDEGTDVSLEGVLGEAGVETEKLAVARPECESEEAMEGCRAKFFGEVGFGEIADFVWSPEALRGEINTTAQGRIDYDWADDAGATYHVSEPFRADLALSFIKRPQELAESGDGFGGSPEARRYQEVMLEPGRGGYAVPMPIRGSRNVASYRALLKMLAPASSIHRFTVSASFADGSVRDSKPVSLFFFRPRPISFETANKPAACYLPEPTE